MALGVTLDGKTYRVKIVYDTYVETVQLIEGPLAGDMLSGRHERDLLGAAHTYSMQVEPDTRYLDDYDDFFAVVSAPQDTHAVTVVSGQSTMTYLAMIETVQHTYKGKLGGRNIYGGLTVTFVPVTPQEVPNE